MWGKGKWRKPGRNGHGDKWPLSARAASAFRRAPNDGLPRSREVPERVRLFGFVFKPGWKARAPSDGWGLRTTLRNVESALHQPTPACVSTWHWETKLIPAASGLILFSMPLFHIGVSLRNYWFVWFFYTRDCSLTPSAVALGEITHLLLLKFTGIWKEKLRVHVIGIWGMCPTGCFSMSCCKSQATDKENDPQNPTSWGKMWKLCHGLDS